MVDPQATYQKIIQILTDNKADYKLFNHKPALTYDDLLEVQKDTGFFGTEGKCMVIRVNEHFIVYITTRGKKLDFHNIQNVLQSKAVRLANPDELKESFGAEPGCAYPFGFDKSISIFIDPNVYNQDWFLFSPVLSTSTIQVKGSDLKRVFASLPNRITETSQFNS